MPNAQKSKPIFENGSHVMAMWRNQYEYLAEILAYRNRSHHHPEYRVKFLWDRVVEWTPASKVRKASQSEVNYVLKFIRQHGDTNTTPCAEVHQSSVNNSARKPPHKRFSPLTKKTPTRTPSSSLVASKKEIKEVKSTLKHTFRSLVDKGRDPAEGQVAQGDMLYDRNIAEFHEACRKRREMKRKLSDSPSSLDQVVKWPKLELSSTPQQTQPTAQTRTRKTNSLMQVESKQSESSLAVKQLTKLDPDDSKPKKEVKASTPQPSVKSSPTVTTAPKKCDESSNTTGAAPPPIAFQCPHCPRKLRRYTLLTAHLYNYHTQLDKQQPQLTTVNGIGVVAKKPQVVNPSAAGDCVFESFSDEQLLGEGTKVPQPASPSAVAGSTVDLVEVATSGECGVASPKTNSPVDLLVFCPVCKFSGGVKEGSDDLVQCFVCRVWCHTRCIDYEAGGVSPWVCGSCSQSSLSRCRSRGRWISGHQHQQQQPTMKNEEVKAKPPPGSNITRLLQEAVSLVAWLHRLTPLLSAGRSAINHIHTVKGETLPSPALSKKVTRRMMSVEDDEDFIGGSGGDNLNALLLQLPVVGMDGLSDDSDTPFVKKPHQRSSSMYSDLAGFLVNLGARGGCGVTGSELPDLIDAMPDDLLDNMQQARPPTTSDSSSLFDATTPVLFDTPTKSIYSLLLTPGGSGDVASDQPSVSTTHAPDETCPEMMGTRLFSGLGFSSQPTTSSITSEEARTQFRSFVDIKPMDSLPECSLPGASSTLENSRPAVKAEDVEVVTSIADLIGEDADRVDVNTSTMDSLVSTLKPHESSFELGISLAATPTKSVIDTVATNTAIAWPMKTAAEEDEEEDSTNASTFPLQQKNSDDFKMVEDEIVEPLEQMLDIIEARLAAIEVELTQVEGPQRENDSLLSPAEARSRVGSGGDDINFEQKDENDAADDNELEEDNDDELSLGRSCSTSSSDSDSEAFNRRQGRKNQLDDDNADVFENDSRPLRHLQKRGSGGRSRHEVLANAPFRHKSTSDALYSRFVVAPTAQSGRGRNLSYRVGGNINQSNREYPPASEGSWSIRQNYK